MYETVKIVKGHGILRMVGTRGCYWVIVEQTDSHRARVNFKTIKAATEYILNNL